LWSQYWLPEPLLHDLRMQVRHQQMRCMGMAQVVQAHAPQVLTNGSNIRIWGLCSERGRPTDRPKETPPRGKAL
jgi:hypothetical protein